MIVVGKGMLKGIFPDAKGTTGYFGYPKIIFQFLASYVSQGHPGGDHIRPYFLGWDGIGGRLPF